MKLGANSVLFGKYDLETAFKWTKICGYDAIEVSAIDGMSQHLVISQWRELAPSIKELIAKYELPIQAMEQPNQDPAILEAAFQAAVEIGIPIVNCGPLSDPHSAAQYFSAGDGPRSRRNRFAQSVSMNQECGCGHRPPNTR